MTGKPLFNVSHLTQIAAAISIFSLTTTDKNVNIPVPVSRRSLSFQAFHPRLHHKTPGCLLKQHPWSFSQQRVFSFLGQCIYRRLAWNEQQYLAKRHVNSVDQEYTAKLTFMVFAGVVLAFFASDAGASSDLTWSSESGSAFIAVFACGKDVWSSWMKWLE